MWLTHLSIRMASVRRSFSSHVSLSSAMIFSVSCRQNKDGHLWVQQTQTETFITSHVLRVCFFFFISHPPVLPWASQWPPHWPGWRCGRGGCWLTRLGWTAPTARARDSSLSLHWTLQRDHPFDWQPGDCSQSSCNRTGLPEREAWEWGGQTDGRAGGRRGGKEQTPDNWGEMLQNRRNRQRNG